MIECRMVHKLIVWKKKVSEDLFNLYAIFLYSNLWTLWFTIIANNNNNDKIM